MQFQTGAAFAEAMDERDTLKSYRDQFYIPQHEGQDCLYLCGNSLGLQPKTVKAAIEHELEQWKKEGVEGHFRGDLPWMYYHKFLQEQTAHVVGAQKAEVVVMNTLTTNLHLMMVSFYRPTKERFKIIMAAGEFPSDQYAIETQVRFHGFDPEAAIVEVAPRAGEDNLRTEDIVATIAKEGPQTALVLFGGVNYFTGQFFDVPAITEATHKAGAFAGFDMAHAAGNVILNLHDWNVDFAVWCSYKYLNSGPGGPSGVFVHERHGNNPDLPRFAGWWGHDESQRFLMRKGFVPMQGAAGWQLSNAPIFSFAAHKASLDIFMEAGMPALREKGERLSSYLQFLIKDLNRQGYDFYMLTPEDPEARGCQASIFMSENGKTLFDHLTQNGVVADWREDNLSGSSGGVIRIAPVPLYNRYMDVYRFVELLKGTKG
jgi:kynureninase